MLWFLRIPICLGVLLLSMRCDADQPPRPKPVSKSTVLGIGFPGVGDLEAEMTVTPYCVRPGEQTTILVSLENGGAEPIHRVLDRPVIDMLVGDDPKNPDLRWTDTLPQAQIPYTLTLAVGERTTYRFEHVRPPRADQYPDSVLISIEISILDPVTRNAVKIYTVSMSEIELTCD